MKTTASLALLALAIPLLASIYTLGFEKNLPRWLDLAGGMAFWVCVILLPGAAILWIWEIVP